MADQNDAPANSGDTVTIMVGSYVDMDEMISSGVVPSLVANGSIGLDAIDYPMAYSTFYGSYDDDLVSELAAAWYGSGSGTQEMTETSGISSGTVTLTNTTGNVIEVAAAGATLTAQDGSLYQTTEEPTNSAWTIGTVQNSAGFYVINPGQTIAVPIQATFQGDDPGSDAAGSINTINVAGVAVNQTSPLSPGSTYTDPSDNDENGWLSTGLGDYNYVFSNQGLNPAEANVNVVASVAWSSVDLASWEGYVTNARSVSILNVAPIVDSSATDEDSLEPFATSGFYAGLRQAALYGGGLEVQQSSYQWITLSPSEQQTIIEELRWCNENGIRSSLMVTSEVDLQGDPDPNFAADTLSMLKQLQGENALPSQIVLENDNPTELGPYYDTNAADVNSLNSLALTLAGNFSFNPTSSEAGLEEQGTSNAQTTLIMTGVQAAENLSGSNLSPYLASQLFSEDPTAALTVCVTDTADLLSLSDAIGGENVSAGGTLTFSGDAADATTFLQAVQASAAGSASGTASLCLTLTDDLGNVTTGITTVNVGQIQPLVTAITASAPQTYTEAGDTILFTVSVSSRVTVTGTPALLLTNEAFADYTGQDQAGDLLFAYKLSATDNVEALRVRGLRLDGASIDDSGSGLALDPDSIDGPAATMMALQSVTETVATPSFSSPSLSMLDVGALTVSGLGPAGVTITILNGTETIGQTTVSTTGAWSTVLTESLPPGSYDLTAVASTSAGTQSAPATAVLTLLQDVVAAPVFSASALSTVDEGTITLSGTGQAGTQVAVADGTAVVARGTVSSGGTWTAPISTPLAVGTYNLTATAEDSYGTLSAATTGVLTLTKDVVAAPAFSALTISVMDAGPIVLSGTGPAGTQIGITTGNEIIGHGLVTDSGTWSIQISTALEPGSYNLSAVATDSFGTTSTAGSATLNLLEPTLPAATLSQPAFVSLGGPLQVSGTGAVGSTIALSVGGQALGSTVVAATGLWSTSIAISQTPATYTLSASETTSSGAPLGATTATLTVLSLAGQSTLSSAAALLTEATPVIAPASSGIYNISSSSPLFVVPDNAGNVQINASVSSAIVVGDGTNLFFSGTQNATIISGDGDNNIFANAGNDTISAGVGQNVIVLGSGNSVVNSTGTDSIIAGSGVDTINLEGKSSTVFGGYGTSGYTGVAMIVNDQQGSNSLIFAATKGNIVNGSNVLGSSNDPNHTTLVAFGNTVVNGGQAPVDAYAGNGAVISLTGYTHNNILVANDGRWANGTNVELDGSEAAGGNEFWAGSGNSTLVGGVGQDTLVAGTGNVTMTGGSGSYNYFDLFSTQPGAHVTITDFAAASGNDIVLFGYGQAGVNSALSTAVQEGPSTIFSLGDGTTITLESYNRSNLSPSQFLATT